MSHASDSPVPAPGARLSARERTTVLVIGGGINGLAVFRDLCLQGVDTILVERDDLSSGASAASSHMVHGGLRYLENGELRLVREAVRERNALLRNAPHRVRPLPTTVPLRSLWSGLVAAPVRVLRHRRGGTSERGALLVKVGLTLYDAYSRRSGRLPAHRLHGGRRTRAAFPDLAPDVRWSATYYDASVDQPERVAVELALDGLAAHPRSRVVTRAEAVGADREGVRVRDRDTGAETTIAADLVVNATGPWTDLTNEALDDPSALMGGTKGSHIVVDSPELLAATGGHEIFFEHADGRIVLIYPLHGRVLIGTTDLPADPREPARCTDAEVEYFLELVAHVFPRIALDASQIVYRFAGIRPLPRSEDAAPGLISRDYRVERGRDDAGRVRLSIVGGKWTTFRALGERVTDMALEVLGRERVRSTLDERIGGSRGLPTTTADREAWTARHLPDVSPARARVLLERYGVRAADVAEHLRAGADQPIAGMLLSTREVDFLVHEEFARTVADVVQRRTTLAFTGDLTAGIVREVAAALGRALEWTDAQVDAHVRETLAALEGEHDVRLAPPVAN